MTLIIVLVVELAAQIAGGFAPNIELFIIFRTICSACGRGCFGVSVTLSMYIVHMYKPMQF